jgi:hypothetical protein
MAAARIENAAAGELFWREGPMPRDQPSGVAVLTAQPQCLVASIDRSEVPRSGQVFFQCPGEPVGADIPRWSVDETRRTLDAEERELFPSGSAGIVIRDCDRVVPRSSWRVASTRPQQIVLPLLPRHLRLGA